MGPKLGMFACAVSFCNPTFVRFINVVLSIHESTPSLNLLVGQPETKLNRLDTSVHETVRVRTAVEDCLLDQFHPTQDVLSRFSSPKIWTLVVSTPLHPHPVPVARFLAIRSNLAGPPSKRGCSVGCSPRYRTWMKGRMLQPPLASQPGSAGT